MELIVTEKDNVARRIADILADNDVSVESTNGVNVYCWADKCCVGLSGHVVEVDFPSEYSNWRDVEPAELVHADIQTRTTREDIVAAIQSLARDADRVAIATDYDREGELIGKEALDLIQAVAPDVPVDRVRFSSITEGEVRDAFNDRADLDHNLAAAGEARQIIDLVWGAALTRFLSLTAGQRGDDFISVGRVQSPTLKLVVDREREIRAFDPETYWEVFVDLQTNGESFQTQYVYEDEDGRQAERIWEADHGERVESTLGAASTATVSSVSRRTRTDTPPAPFDTTAFIGAAGSLGYSASQAMDIAESLYTDGYITYPRTDNTVYPDDVDLEDLLSSLAMGPFGDAAESVADGALSPTQGEEETTDHPPIHPTTDLPDRSDLSEDEWDIYELVVRRFFATLADPAVWEHLRIEATVEDLMMKANGQRLLDPGYHAVYPYIDTSETYVPDLEEGEALRIDEVERAEKETQPPRRYGESRLIETMADLGLGTKSTRHNTIEKLYDRGYLEGDPPRPTELAMAVVEAAEEYADLVTSEEMTRELEQDMTAIAEGNATLDEVTAESRDVLDRVFEELDASREELGEFLRTALKADRTLGPCPESGEDLVLRQASNGSHFVGCDGYPECRFTLPLPNRGEPVLLDEVCETHELQHVKILDGRSTFVHGCPQCQVEAANETEDRVIGACPSCGETDDGELAIKQLQTGNRLVGCTRYPDCEYSLPLPRNGDIEITDEYCSDHELPELVVHNGDDPWELGCPICNYETYRERQADRDVTAVDGIGDATAEKLAAAGIESVGDLRGVDPESIAGEVDGVSAERLAEFKQRADS